MEEEKKNKDQTLTRAAAAVAATLDTPLKHTYG